MTTRGFEIGDHVRINASGYKFDSMKFESHRVLYGKIAGFSDNFMSYWVRIHGNYWGQDEFIPECILERISEEEYLVMTVMNS